jgi:hypothetical protein
MKCFFPLIILLMYIGWGTLSGRFDHENDLFSSEAIRRAQRGKKNARGVRKLKNKRPIETHFPEFKWIFYDCNQCRELIRDIIIYPHIKFWWYRRMLNFYRPFLIPYFGSHFENGRHLEIFKTQNCNQNNTQKTISKSVKWLFVNLFQNLGSGYMKLLPEFQIKDKISLYLRLPH